MSNRVVAISVLECLRNLVFQKKTFENGFFKVVFHIKLKILLVKTTSALFTAEVVLKDFANTRFRKHLFFFKYPKKSSNAI